MVSHLIPSAAVSIIGLLIKSSNHQVKSSEMDLIRLNEQLHSQQQVTTRMAAKLEATVTSCEKMLVNLQEEFKAQTEKIESDCISRTEKVISF